MDGEQFASFLEDMITNGQQEPIVIFEGRILDGRNRYAALRKIGVNPSTTLFAGSEMDALRFVASKNLSRRHMNASQRAAVGAAILELMREHPSLSETLKFDEHAFHQASNLTTLAKAWIDRPNRAHGVQWPPERGFMPEAPETLKAFARSKGVENISITEEGDEREVDQDAVLEHAKRGGMTEDELAKDIPAPEKCAIDWSANEVSGHGPKPKNKGGRPKDESVAVIQSAGISRRSAKRMAKAIETAEPEVRAALAAGTVSVRRAEVIAALPKEEQASALANRPAPRKKTLDAKTITSALFDASNNIGAFVSTCKPGEVNALHAAVVAAEAAIRPYLENANG